jgi:zinc finger protein-like protein
MSWKCHISKDLAEVQELVVLANDVSAAMKAHLAKEEQDVLPALRKQLSRAEKHTVVWKSLQALPLRLLERILPWVALHIGTQVCMQPLLLFLHLGRGPHPQDHH